MTDPVVASRLSLILGEVFVALGELATADSYLQSAEEALRKAIPGDDPRRVEALHVRAWGLLRAGRFEEAGPLYEAALAMHRRLGGDSDIVVAKCLEGSAQCAARAGRIDEALALLAEARPRRERLGDPMRLSFHWHNVANTLQQGKRYDEAADFLIAQKELEQFIKLNKPYFSNHRIVEFATKMQVHPGIIVGQLQHRREIGFNTHHASMVKIRDLATMTAFTDGWGHPVPITKYEEMN